MSLLERYTDRFQISCLSVVKNLNTEFGLFGRIIKAQVSAMGVCKHEAHCGNVINFQGSDALQGPVRTSSHNSKAFKLS